MARINKRGGFTLAELLIVIAIIAILIAIAIPVFAGQLDNAKLQTDHANIRSAYAQVQVANLEGKDLTGNYQTDGTFGSGKDVTIKADSHGSGTGCADCVVDCSGFSKGATITVSGSAGSYTITAGSTGSP